jgi:serine/threonine protein kinase
MSAPNLKRVEELFHQAVALPENERSAFLAQACAGDAALMAAVRELLRHDDASETFLMSPVADAAHRQRQDAATLIDHGAPPLMLSPPPSLPGYELLEELGRGGMGVVYKARQTRLNRLVAVKMLPSGAAVSHHELERFRAEAETLARLHHPNIVTIYDVGEHDGRPFFVLEYIPGPSLAQVLAGRSQDPLASAHLIETIARAMHAVHQCGIIHRDLKPANILLQKDEGEGMKDEQAPSSSSFILHRSTFLPKITDFGLAKDPADRRRLTQTGMTLGTPCYMAPEQVLSSGQAIGPAADVYALGSILYEMLVGRPPFDADTPLETLMQLRSTPPLSPARLRPRLPRDLVTICLKCLEKAPRRRYASALELADDLQRVQKGEPIQARPVSAVEHAYRWCRRRPLVTGLLAVVAALAVAFVVTVLIFNARLQAALEQVKAQNDVQRRQIIELNIHIGIASLESGDAFVALLHFTEALALDERASDVEKQRQRIARTLQDCPRLTEMLNLESPAIGAAVTVDGGLVATAGPDHAVAVWQVPARRQIVAGLAHPQPPVHAALSADGKLLGTVTVDGTARIWDLATGKVRVLPTSPLGHIHRLIFHANGRLLLARYGGEVCLWDLTAPDPTPLAREEWKTAKLAVTSSNAQWLFTTDAENHGQVWHVASRQPVGQGFTLPTAARQAALSSDGHRVAIVGADRTVSIWEVAKGRQVGKPYTLPHDGGTVTFSADGERLLVIDGGGEGRIWELATGRSLGPLLHHVGPVVSAALDAGGEHLVTVAKHGVVCFWDCHKSAVDTSHPVDALRALAQVHAGGYLDEKYLYHPSNARQWRDAWKSYKAFH